MAEKNESAADGGNIISLDVAGRLLMIGPERIRQLMKDGYIPRDKPGRVALVGAVQGYIRFLKDLASKTTKTAADSRVRDARAAEIEMRNAERMRKLIPVEDASAALDYLLGVVNEQLNGLPARITRDLEQRRKIEAEVNAAKETIAKALAASADVVEKGGDLPYAGQD